MPQLVAAFHSLVGMAACLVAVAAIYTPAGLRHRRRRRRASTCSSLIELSLGLAIGAVTFTGSVIAFAKLNGNMSGAPILLPARHLLNIAIGLGIVGAGGGPGDERRRGALGLLGDLRARAADRRHPDHPDRRRRHAGRGVDAEQLLRLGGGGAGLHAGEHHPDHHRRPGGLVGRDPQLHHVQGDEPQLRLGDPGRLRRPTTAPRRPAARSRPGR